MTEYPLPPDTKLTEYPCYGEPKQITLSWTQLSNWMACHHRVKLIHKGKKSKLTNARNFLAGKVTDITMRKALESAPKDPQGRLLSLELTDLMAPLPEAWERSTTNLEKNTLLKWNGLDPLEDQKKILTNVKKALKGMHPILQENLMGRKFIPEFRPETMPVFGIPGPNGEPTYIRLYLAVDVAVQIEEDPDQTKMGEWGLYDLKTTSTADYINKTLPQLVFYDLAFNALTGKYAKDHALWAPLLKQPVQKVHVTDEHRKQVINWIISYCHGVWAGQEEFTKDDTNCYTCPTRSACPKIVTPITRDEQGLSRAYFGDPEGMMKP